MTDLSRDHADDLLSAQLRALASDQDAPPGFAADVMSNIRQPAQRSMWQRMLDSFSPTTPRHRRVAALALLPATAAALSFVVVLWLAKPSVASRDDARPMTSDLLAADFTIYAPGSNTVFLAGDFNGWAKNKLRLRDDDGNGTFSVVLSLPPGRYGYVFWVDGKRVLLPNKQRAVDARRGEHSVLDLAPNRLRMSLPDANTDAYAAALNKLTTAIRNLPVAHVFDQRSCTKVAGVRVNNSSTAADELQFVHADGKSLSSLLVPFGRGSTVLIVSDGSRFAPGDRVLVSDATHAHLLEVRSVNQQGGVWSLGIAASSCAGLKVTYAPGAFVFKADIARVYLSQSTLMFDSDSGGPRAPVRLAANVHDFQVALGVDRDRDGLLFETRRADDEWYYNAPGDDGPSATEIPRAVRLTIVARSRNRGHVTLEQIEDHKLAAAPNGARLRVISLTVALRNLELRR